LNILSFFLSKQLAKAPGDKVVKQERGEKENSPALNPSASSTPDRDPRAAAKSQ